MQQQSKYDQTFLQKFPRINGKKVQNALRKFGSFLAGMIMPLIGLIIAWGLFTAIILAVKSIIMEKNNIENWTEQNSKDYLWNMDVIIGMGISFLIPFFVGFFGGKQVLGIKGGILGAIATLGVIGGANTGDKFFNLIMVNITGEQSLSTASAPTMILGAMIIAPLATFIFKKLESLWSGRVKSGYEMLVNNISVGLFGLVFIFFGFWVIAPLMAVLQSIFYIIINGIYNNGLLPLLPIFVETEKVLFLNNAVNHGIFGPLGYQEVASSGKSVLFFMDPNPGQGMGLLLAYFFFSNSKENKGQAAAAMPIHFIGGIHEVYYPFVLTKPINLLWMICGGIFATVMYQIFNVGGVFTPSPGSIIMNYLACNPQPLDYAGLSLAIFGAMAITFTLTSLCIIFERLRNGEKVYFNPYYANIMNRYAKGIAAQTLYEINKFKEIKAVSYKEQKSMKTISIDGVEVKKQVIHKWEKINFVDGSNEMFVIPNNKVVIGFRYIEKPVYDKQGNKKLDSNGKPRVKKYLIKLFKKLNKDEKFNKFSIVRNKIHFEKITNNLFENAFYKHLEEKDKQILKQKGIKYKTYRVNKEMKEIKSIDYFELPEIKVIRTIEFKPYKDKHGNIKTHSNQKDIFWQLRKQETINDLKNELKDEKDELKAISSSKSEDKLFEVSKRAKKIYFACEAGMGSSAMGAGLLRKYFDLEKIQGISISNCAIKDLPSDVDIVVTQESFKKFVNDICPNAYVYTIKQFLKSSEYDKLIKTVKKAKA